MKPANRAPYTEDEARAGMELAIAIGRRKAIQQLGISHSTFQNWTQKYPQIWSDLKAGDPEAQRKGFAKSLEDLAQEGMALEHEAIEVAQAKLKGADLKELAAIIKATAASRQAATVGARTVMGEADVVEHNVNFPQLEQAMQAILEQAAPPALPVVNEAEYESR